MSLPIFRSPRRLKITEPEIPFEVRIKEGGVLLKTALAAIPPSAENAIVHFSRHEFLLQCWTEEDVVSILRLWSSACDKYTTSGSRSFSTLVPYFRSLINEADDRDTITIAIDLDNSRVNITRTGVVMEPMPNQRCFTFPVTPYEAPFWDIDPLDIQASVAMPFRMLYGALVVVGSGSRLPCRVPGETKDAVHVFISTSVVRFVSGNKRFFLRPELQQYVLTGAEDWELLYVTFTYSDDLASAFNKAGRMSNWMWLHVGKPSFLNFPFGGRLGRLLFPARC